jgi:dethiobiotin synthase (EC 6.3.3.3)
LNHQTMIDKLESLKAQFDMILIEGAGGIAVPIYEYSDHFYMTTDLIKDTSDFIVSVLPSKLGAINDAIVHQKYIDHQELPPNVLIMNNYTDSAIEQDNLHTIEKLIHKSVYTLGHQATQESFSEAFIQRIIGGSNG